MTDVFKVKFIYSDNESDSVYYYFSNLNFFDFISKIPYISKIKGGVSIHKSHKEMSIEEAWNELSKSNKFYLQIEFIEPPFNGYITIEKFQLDSEYEKFIDSLDDIVFNIKEEHEKDFQFFLVRKVEFGIHKGKTFLSLVDTKPSITDENGFSYRLDSEYSLIISDTTGDIEDGEKAYNRIMRTIYGNCSGATILTSRDVQGYALQSIMAVVEGYDGPDFKTKTLQEVLDKLNLSKTYKTQIKLKLNKMYKKITSGYRLKTNQKKIIIKTDSPTNQ